MTSDEVRAVIRDGVDRKQLLDAFALNVRKRDDWLQAIVEGHDDVDQVKIESDLTEQKTFDAVADAVIAALAGAGLVIGERADLSSLTDAEYEVMYDVREIPLGLALVRVVTP